MAKKLSPAELVLSRFSDAGISLRALSRELQIDHANIVRWRKSKEDRGTDGRVPSAYLEPLLGLAKRKRVKLTAQELIVGGTP